MWAATERWTGKETCASTPVDESPQNDNARMNNAAGIAF
jgi:hypothetical protein